MWWGQKQGQCKYIMGHQRIKSQCTTLQRVLEKQEKQKNNSDDDGSDDSTDEFD